MQLTTNIAAGCQFVLQYGGGGEADFVNYTTEGLLMCTHPCGVMECDPSSQNCKFKQCQVQLMTTQLPPPNLSKFAVCCSRYGCTLVPEG